MSGSYRIKYRLGIPPEEGGHTGTAYSRRIEHDIIVERNVAVTMRDGVRLYVDVFRPLQSMHTALPTLVTYSPYGKHGRKSFAMFTQGQSGKQANPGMDASVLSHYTVWEGPDPLRWCQNGYVVINADTRGSWGCEGSLTFNSRTEARDGFDLIEWCAAQPWSNGRVGMAGVSYLAWSQWNVAASCPPHLLAINPWEGYSDPYRDRAMHGGIRETKFREWWIESTAYSRTRVEDVVAMDIEHPLFDDYWADRTPDLAAIRIPVYAVVDWGDHGIHTRGTIEGFKQVSSTAKWLEVHGRLKWPYFYSEQSFERQLAFFDAHLREDGKPFDRPRVSIEVRESYCVGETYDEADWPLPETVYTNLFMTGRGALEPEPGPGDTVQYDSVTGVAEFTYTFGSDTELTGNMALKLWVQTDVAEDIDLFVSVEKLDAAGNKVGFPFQSLYADGPVALGWLRASHREIDPLRSTPGQPWHTHQRELPVPKGEPVEVDVEILPSSTLFRRGERLRLCVQGFERYSYPGETVVIVHEQTRNVGPHIIHTGGAHASRLVVPLIRRGSAR